MSQTVITKAFVEWKARQAADNQFVTLDEFIFAYVPGQGDTVPVANTETIPTDKIVYRQAVGKTGVVNANSVVYSVTLGADVGDFDFNWIGLANKATGTLGMIIHAPTQRKVKNASGQQGNVLVRSMLMEYSGAQASTNITTPAETWQIDFTARLAGMDEAVRLSALDIYGAGAFFDDGFLVAKTGTQFFVTAGLGYVGGLRAALAANRNIAVSAKPTKVWVDVCYQGTLTSAYKTEIKFTVAASLANYTTNGVTHYVFALASIDANGVITDLRPKGSLSDQTGNNSFVRKDKNLTDIANPATALATLGGVPKTRTVNKKALSADITLTAADVGAMVAGEFGLGGKAPLLPSTITLLADPSIIGFESTWTVTSGYTDGPAGNTSPTGVLRNIRRAYDAGCALIQYLYMTGGTIYVRTGGISSGVITWNLTNLTSDVNGWRKVMDTASMTLADLTRLGVAQSGANADITSMSKLTSIASSVKMAINLEVASSIQANYRIGILRANDYEAYMSFTSRAGLIAADNLPTVITSMGNMYFRVSNTLADTDPHTGRALGGLSAAIYPTGEGIMRMDARDETGTIKARIVCDGQSDTVQVSNGYFQPLMGINLYPARADSVIRGKNDAIILRDHNNGNVTLAASLKDAGSTTGGALYLGYNKPDSSIFTSSVIVDSPLTINYSVSVKGAVTFETALPVASGGTGAKNATDAVKNLGALPANGTAVAAAKLATERKIAGVAFDGTKDISLGAGNVGAVASTGGDVGYLNNALHYGTKPGSWEGAGGFANQYSSPYAPFIVPFGYAAPRDVSSYAPIVKGVIQTTSYGYGTAVSFGALTSGGTKFASGVIHVIGDSGVSQAWLFDPMDGSFGCPGPINAGSLNTGNIYSSLGIYEQGQRVYSPNNPQPNIVQDMRFGSSAEYQERSNNEHIDGGVMTSFKDSGSSNYWIRVRQLQKLINNNWYTVSYT